MSIVKINERKIRKERKQLATEKEFFALTREEMDELESSGRHIDPVNYRTDKYIELCENFINSEKTIRCHVREIRRMTEEIAEVERQARARNNGYDSDFVCSDDEIEYDAGSRIDPKNIITGKRR